MRMLTMLYTLIITELSTVDSNENAEHVIYFNKQSYLLFKKNKKTHATVSTKHTKL